MGYTVNYQKIDTYDELPERSKFIFSSLFIYLALEGEIKWSNKKLALLLGTSEKAVEKVLKQLDDAKLISRTNKFEKQFNEYSGSDEFRVVDRSIKLNIWTFKEIAGAKNEKAKFEAIGKMLVPEEYTWEGRKE